MVNLPRYGHYGPWDDAPTENPEGHWVESPTFRYQLFIPRHEKEWKGLPKRLRLEPGGARTLGTSLSNKPGGAFWTSSLGPYDDEEESSDWDQWMRGNMPEWHVQVGIVLEVSPDARVKHLRTREEADEFLTEFGTPGPLSAMTGEPPERQEDFLGGGRWWGMMQVAPDWPRIITTFDALHLEGDALRHPGFYGWDAESTAWFTTTPLREVRKIVLPKAEGWRDEDDDEEEEEANPPPRRQRKRLKNGRLTRAENARLFRRLMRQ